jgi:hypothetical protein
MGFLRSIFGLFLFLFVVSCGNNGSPSSAHQAGGISSVENVDTMQADNESVSGDSGVVLENNTNAEIQLLSWNIANLGKSKDDGEIEAMVRVIKDFEVVAIQEVVAGPGGPQAVARLVDALNRRGSKWDYVVSNPTSGGKGVERYAFLWKPSRVKLDSRRCPSTTQMALRSFQSWSSKFQPDKPLPWLEPPAQVNQQSLSWFHVFMIQLNSVSPQ